MEATPQPDRGGSSRYGRPDTHPPPVRSGSGPRQQRTETHRPPRGSIAQRAVQRLTAVQGFESGKLVGMRFNNVSQFQQAFGTRFGRGLPCANARSAACTARRPARQMLQQSPAEPLRWQGYRPAVFPLAAHQFTINQQSFCIALSR